MICPDCKADNIPGADACESCGQDLRTLDLPGPEDEFTHHLMTDHLGDLRSEPPLYVSPGDPVALAVHFMQHKRAPCVLVRENDELIGILTERDVLLKAAGDDVDLNAVVVRDIMTPDPVILREEDSIAVALHKMSVGGFRHIPLVTQQGATHLISIRDLVRHLSPYIPEQRPALP